MKRLLLPLTVCLALLSCQKEIEDITEQQRTTGTECKLVKSYSYNAFGVLVDSTNYAYKGDKVVKVFKDGSADSLVLQYTGNNITKRNYYSSGTVEVYDDLSYNTDGTLKTVRHMLDMSLFGGSGFACTDSVLFQWSGGKLLKRICYELDFSTLRLVEAKEDIFEYTGGNITKAIRIRFGSPGGVLFGADTTLVQYDAQPNFLKKGGFPHLIADAAFIDLTMAADYFVLFLSENNPVKVWDSLQPANAQDVVYVKDAKGNVMLIISGGDPLFGYAYQCP